MNWNHVLLSALVGVALAGIASTLYKKGKVNKLAAIAIFVVGIIGLALEQALIALASRFRSE